MTVTPRQIAFHIGAHKTATTHLQLSLDAAADRLAAMGVQYHGPERFRLPGRSLLALFGLRDDAPPPQRGAAAQLAALAKGARRLVLSEENFIGPLNYPKGGSMRLRYKSAAERLGGLAAAMDQEIAVFLAVRQPTSFLNSAYCQSLTGGQIMPVDTYLTRNPLASVDWAQLVTSLRNTSGIGPITVWRYEDYRAVYPQIMQGLVGTATAAELVPPHPRVVNRGLSAQGVAEVLHRANDTTIDVPAAVARHLLSVDHGFAPFDGFSPDAHAQSAATYAAQLTQIGALPDVTLLRPADQAKGT